MSTINYDHISEINENLDFYIKNAQIKVFKERAKILLNRFKIFGNRILALLSLLGMGICELKLQVDKILGMVSASAVGLSPLLLILSIADGSFTFLGMAKTVGLFVGINAVWFGMDVGLLFASEALGDLFEDRDLEIDSLFDSIDESETAIKNLKNIIEKLKDATIQIEDKYTETAGQEFEEKITSPEEEHEVVKFEPAGYTDGYTDDISEALTEYQNMYQQYQMPPQKSNPKLTKNKRD